MKVFINPGHSPNSYPDPGAVNPYNGITESEVCYKIGSLVADFLKPAGFIPILYQASDLVDISSKANLSFAGLFVSIHCNASASHFARGVEVFHFPGSVYGNLLATSILKQLSDSIPNITNRGVKAANFHVLRETNMPAVLIELAFIDNPDDFDLLSIYQIDFAKAIARGISDYVD